MDMDIFQRRQFITFIGFSKGSMTQISSGTTNLCRRICFLIKILQLILLLPLTLDVYEWLWFYNLFHPTHFQVMNSIIIKETQLCYLLLLLVKYFSFVISDIFVLFSYVSKCCCISYFFVCFSRMMAWHFCATDGWGLMICTSWNKVILYEVTEQSRL